MREQVFLRKIFFLFTLLVVSVSFYGQQRITVVEPKQDAILFDSTVVFFWNESDLEAPGSNYKLTIGSDSSLANTIYIKNNILVNKDTVLLNSDQVVYWKVELEDGNGVLAETEVRSITISNIYHINGLSLFLNADSGVVVNGSNQIGKWYNLADTTNNAVQTNVSQFPILTPGISVLNNKSSVRLDGTDDLLQINSTIALQEVYAVANWRGANIVFPTFNAFLTGQTSFTVFSASANTSQLLPSNLFPQFKVNNKPTYEFAPLNTYKLIEAIRTAPTPRVFANMNVGRDRANTSRYWHGDIATIIGFSTMLSDSTRQLVNAYLCTKYSKDLNLGEDISFANSLCDSLFQADTLYTSYVWSNGDTTSFSNLELNSNYRLTVTNKFGCEFTDEISTANPLNIPEDQNLCPGDTFIFDTQLSKSLFTFNWSNGTNDSLIAITNEGEYHLELIDGKGCIFQSDTFFVSIDSSLTNFTLGNDTSLCAGNILKLANDSSIITSYLWSTGSISPSIVVSNSGIYWLQVSNGSCIFRDSISITISGISPTADYSTASLCFNDSATFTDNSTTQPGNSIVRWFWDFGDTNSAIGQNVKHQFDSVRAYNVRLEVESNAGCIGEITKVVTIHPKPIAKFEAFNRCELDTVMFNDQSTISSGSIVSYSWDFGDISVLDDTSSSNNPTYSYLNSGLKNVQLITISDMGCSDTLIKPTLVNPKPQAGFSFSGTIFRDSTFFVNSSSIANGAIIGYTWNFGNGQNSTQESPNIKYGTRGDFAVSLQVTSDSSCSDTITKVVSIVDGPPEFTTVFPKQATTLMNLPYLEWNFSDSAITYEVQVATDSSFNNLEFRRSIGQNNQVRNVALSSGLKFWRVLAKNDTFYDTTNVAQFTIFRVSELDSLNMWLRADTGIQVSGGLVSQWNGISDSAIVLTPGSSNRSPILRADELNHYPVLNFDNIDDRFITPVTLSGKNFTISSVYSVEQSGGGSLIRGSNNWNFGRVFSQHRFSNGNTVNGKPIIGNQYVAHTAISTNDTAKNFVNDSLYGSSVNNFSPGTLVIGGTPIGGNIAEIIVVNGKIDATERAGLDNYLMDKYAPPVDAGPDRVVCSFPDSIVLNVDYALSFKWDTGDTTDKVIVNSPGKYFVTVTDVFERTSVDSVQFILDTFNRQVPIPFRDTSICRGNRVDLIAGRSHYSYSWNTGDTSNLISVDSAQLYIVELINCYGNISRDSVNVRVNEPVFDLGVDTTICHNELIQINPDSTFSGVNYLWSTGETTATVLADTAETYSLLVTDQLGCQFIDSISITIDSTLFGLTLGNDTTLCRGNQIELKNPNSNIISYQWSTGSFQPSATVDTNGRYSLKIGNGRCFVNDSINVTIKGDAPQANFTALNLCFRDSTLFVESSVPPVGDSLVAWYWDFGNGQIDSVQNPTYYYQQRGSFRPILRVETDKGCTDTVSKALEIYPLPVANFNFQNSIACSKSPYFHIDSSFVSSGVITSYLWNFGDTASNQNSSTRKDDFHTFDTLGVYEISLEVTTDRGCKDTVQKQLSVNPTPNVDYSFDGNCLADSVRFTNKTVLASGNIFDYKWDFFRFGNVDFVGLPEENPVVKFLAAGTYTAQLRVRTAINGTPQCSSTKRDTIFIYNSPTADFIVPEVCEDVAFTVKSSSTSVDSILDHRFIYSNTTTSLEDSITILEDSAGIYNLNLKVSTINGCSDSISKTVEVRAKPNVNFSILNNNTGIPFDIALNNQTQGAVDYTWNFGNGDSDTSFTPDYVYRDTGKFDLQLIAVSQQGCIDSVSKEVISLPNYLDAELTNIFLNENSLGDIVVSAQILNSGFNTINQLLMVVDLNNEFEFREIWNKTIYSGDREGYVFASSFIPDAGRKIDFVCVKISSVNGGLDSISSNNVLCEKGFNETVSIKIYPNPVEDNLTLQYTLPDDGKISFEVVDALGRIVDAGFSITQEEGYYVTLIPMQRLERGIYHYRFIYNGELTVGKFLKK